nr:ribonuclease H-like domain-containing protein [Tanacetum cinerariifolium]
MYFGYVLGHFSPFLLENGTSASSSSNTQNVAFVSADNTNNTNDINDDDMEEMDLKWQVAMISMRIKKFYKRTGKKAKKNQDNRRRDVGYNGNKARDNGRRPAYQDDSKRLVTIDGEDIDWSGYVEEDTQNYAMMAYSSNNSGSDNEDYPHKALKDKGIVDNGCSRYMIRNKAYLVYYQEFKGGSVAFGGSNGRITSKGKIKAGRLDFEDVCYVEELKHYNLFSVSQMCDKKNKVLFTDTDYLVLSLDF